MATARALLAACVFEVALFWVYGLGFPLPAVMLVVIIGHPLKIPLIAHVPLWASVITLVVLMGAARSLHDQFAGSQRRLFLVLAAGLLTGLGCLHLTILWFALIVLGVGMLILVLLLWLLIRLAMRWWHQHH